MHSEPETSPDETRADESEISLVRFSPEFRKLLDQNGLSQDPCSIFAVTPDLHIARLMVRRMGSEAMAVSVSEVPLDLLDVAETERLISSISCVIVVWHSLNDPGLANLLMVGEFAFRHGNLVQVGIDLSPERIPARFSRHAPFLVLSEHEGELLGPWDEFIAAVRGVLSRVENGDENAKNLKAPGRFAKLKRFLRWSLFIILLAIILLVFYRPLLIAWADRFQSYGGAAPVILNDDPSRLAPQMVVVPGGEFRMGSEDGDSDEKPVHQVRIASFAIGRFEVTFAEYDVFAHETNRRLPDDAGWGRGSRPVIDVTWNDATAYAAWLAEKTGKPYRLPTEAEWEYAARGAMPKRYWWGDELQQSGKVWANCYECGSAWDNDRTAPVGRFAANPFGLYDTAGNVWEWVEDCWHDDYRGAPADGRAWEDGETCASGRRVLRGGSWGGEPVFVRSASRNWGDPGNRNDDRGFRLARTL